jgi:hypothetical protein
MLAIRMLQGFSFQLFDPTGTSWRSSDQFRISGGALIFVT